MVCSAAGWMGGALERKHSSGVSDHDQKGVPELYRMPYVCWRVLSASCTMLSMYSTGSTNAGAHTQRQGGTFALTSASNALHQSHHSTRKYHLFHSLQRASTLITSVCRHNCDAAVKA